MSLKKLFSLACLLPLILACSERSVLLVSGEKRALSAHQGEWLLINYWAVWCAPCLEEIPELNKLDAREDVVVFAFNYDQPEKDTLLSQAERFAIAYPSLMEDPAEQFQQPSPSALPATMVLNGEGEFVRWLYGPQTYESVLQVLNKPGS